MLLLFLFFLWTAYNKVLARVGCTLEDIPKIVHENEQLNADIVPQLQSQIVSLEQALTELLEEKDADGDDDGDTIEVVDGDGIGNLEEEDINGADQPAPLKIEASSMSQVSK